MPFSLSCNQNNSRKTYRLTVLFLFTPLFFFGQSLTGLWTGALTNDSATVRKDQLFEIVLTEYKGKVYGYSRSEFIVNDTLYYIVKRVKGTIQGAVCEVIDDEIIAYNFRGKLDKGIKVTSTFRRNGNDSAWYLVGTWKTNATKKYYSVTGKVDLGQEKDLTASKIFPHLEELKMADEVVFYKERNEGIPVAKIAKPQRVKTEYTFNNDPSPSRAIAAPDLERADTEIPIPEIKKTDNTLARTGTKEVSSGKTAVVIMAPDFERADPEIPVKEVKKPDSPLSRTATKEISTGKTSVAVTAPDVQRADPEAPVPDVKKPNNSLARTETKDMDATTSKLQPAVAEKSTAVNKPVTIPTKKAPITNTAGKANPVSQTTTAKTNIPGTTTATDKKPVVSNNNAKPNAIVNPNAAQQKPNTNSATGLTTVAQDNKELKKPEATPGTQKANSLVSTTPKKTIEELTTQVATIAGRKSEFSQVVDFKSDSLLLALYDNGEIDGDTVSVFMNGEMIMARQGLKASAIRKTIYIQPGQEEDFTLVLFADNLGKYPPNTGLLVVHDGEDIYHLRFSSDFQKSTGIVFRRKK